MLSVIFAASYNVEMLVSFCGSNGVKGHAIKDANINDTRDGLARNNETQSMNIPHIIRFNVILISSFGLALISTVCSIFLVLNISRYIQCFEMIVAVECFCLILMSLGFTSLRCLRYIIGLISGIYLGINMLILLYLLPIHGNETENSCEIEFENN